jgi:acetamidase/formamidase
MGLAATEQVSSGPPGRFGGNLDLKELTKGSTLFLPVLVEGGLFYTGDGHGAQGDGEVNINLAVDFEVTQMVNGVKGIHGMIPKSLFKNLEDTYWAKTN